MPGRERTYITVDVEEYKRLCMGYCDDEEPLGRQRLSRVDREWESYCRSYMSIVSRGFEYVDWVAVAGSDGEYDDLRELTIKSAEELAESRVKTIGPDILIQAGLVTCGDRSAEGTLIRGVAIPWFEIFLAIQDDPDFLFQFVQYPRRFEEFIAGAYERLGWKDVVLTPQSGDRGRDLILSATFPGAGSVIIVEELKAYSPGRYVTAHDISRLAWVLSRDSNVSKGFVTTTSRFAPKVFDEFKVLMPGRLELKDGRALREWLSSVAKNSRGDGMR